MKYKNLLSVVLCYFPVSGSRQFTAMTWNVLSERMYRHKHIAWKDRAQKILTQMLMLDSDVIALQVGHSILFISFFSSVSVSSA